MNTELTPNETLLRLINVQATLRAFRDFVIARATQWDNSRGGSTQNMIWQKVADAIRPSGLPRYHHHKRTGDHFLVLSDVEVQTSRPIQEGDKLTFYFGEDGKPWARLDEEFNDGRFTLVER